MDPFNIYIYIMIFPTEKQHCSGGANLQPSGFKNIHLNQMPLPKVTLPKASRIHMVLPGFSGNFLSLQFASDTCHLYTSTLFKFLMGGVQGAGCLNQPGHLKLSGNIPQNCHAQLQHSYHLLLYEKIPPPVHLRSLLHSFYQGIMVYHT